MPVDANGRQTRRSPSSRYTKKPAQAAPSSAQRRPHASALDSKLLSVANAALEKAVEKRRGSSTPSRLPSNASAKVAGSGRSPNASRAGQVETIENAEAGRNEGRIRKIGAALGQGRPSFIFVHGFLQNNLCPLRTCLRSCGSC